MKAINLHQAIEFVINHFNKPLILKTWDTIDTTEILFETDGVQYELMSNRDAIFTNTNPFTIFEA